MVGKLFAVQHAKALLSRFLARPPNAVRLINSRQPETDLFCRFHYIPPSRIK
jgi:hypothetical protein